MFAVVLGAEVCVATRQTDRKDKLIPKEQIDASKPKAHTSGGEQMKQR